MENPIPNECSQGAYACILLKGDDVIVDGLVSTVASRWSSTTNPGTVLMEINTRSTWHRACHTQVDFWVRWESGLTESEVCSFFEGLIPENGACDGWSVDVLRIELLDRERMAAKWPSLEESMLTERKWLITHRRVRPVGERHLYRGTSGLWTLLWSSDSTRSGPWVEAAVRRPGCPVPVWSYDLSPYNLVPDGHCRTFGVS